MQYKQRDQHKAIVKVNPVNFAVEPCHVFSVGTDRHCDTKRRQLLFPVIVVVNLDEKEAQSAQTLRTVFWANRVHQTVVLVVDQVILIITILLRKSAHAALTRRYRWKCTVTLLGIMTLLKAFVAGILIILHAGLSLHSTAQMFMFGIDSAIFPLKNKAAHEAALHCHQAVKYVQDEIPVKLALIVIEKVYVS